MQDKQGCVGCLLTFLFLMSIDLVLMFFTGQQLWWMKKAQQLTNNNTQNGLFTCRQAFHMAIFVLVSLRAIDFGFFSLAHLLIGKIGDDGTLSVIYDFVSVFGIICALLYCHAYSTLLLFWVSFLQKIGKKKLSFDPVLHDANLYTRISLGICVTLSLFFVGSFVLAEIFQKRVLYWDIASTVILIIMGSEAVAFLVVGVLLYLYSKQLSFTSRGFQIIVSASIISLLFILRMVYIILDTHWRPMKWWSAFFCFFIFLEDIPIIMMLYFQRSFPKRAPPKPEKESLLPSGREEELTSWEDFTDEDRISTQTEKEESEKEKSAAEGVF